MPGDSLHGRRSEAVVRKQGLGRIEDGRTGCVSLLCSTARSIWTFGVDRIHLVF
jgi:hypothetical protein